MHGSLPPSTNCETQLAHKSSLGLCGDKTKSIFNNVLYAAAKYSDMDYEKSLFSFKSKDND